MRTQRPLALVELFLFTVVLAAFLTANAVANETDVIGGIVVEAAGYPEVVLVRSGDSSCTGVIVGPRVIATAAHCVTTGRSVEFEIAGKKHYAEMTRSELYPEIDHDLALGLVKEEIEGVRPASIGKKLQATARVAMLGFGCTTPGGGGGNDGILRLGMTVVTQLDKYDAITRHPAGAALCFGDSGAPLYAGDARSHTLLGVGSKGNINDTSYFVRVDTAASQVAFWKFIMNHEVTICGINGDC